MSKGIMNVEAMTFESMEMPLPKVTSTQENKRTMKRLQEEWNLGPEKASADPSANKPYWNKLAAVWGVSQAQARRQLCANCEYFQDSPRWMEAMEAIPFNEFDADGGGRGYCTKFDFICHNLRTCQAWEEE